METEIQSGEMWSDYVEVDTYPLTIHDHDETVCFTKPEAIALRDFLIQLDLDGEVKDCKDGQHSGDTGKCGACGRTYIHGKQ